MLERRLAGSGIDRHAADGVADHDVIRRMMMVVAVAVVMCVGVIHEYLLCLTRQWRYLSSFQQLEGQAQNALVLTTVKTASIDEHADACGATHRIDDGQLGIAAAIGRPLVGAPPR